MLERFGVRRMFSILLKRNVNVNVEEQTKMATSAKNWKPSPASAAAKVGSFLATTPENVAAYSRMNPTKDLSSIRTAFASGHSRGKVLKALRVSRGLRTRPWRTAALSSLRTSLRKFPARHPLATAIIAGTAIHSLFKKSQRAEDEKQTYR